MLKEETSLNDILLDAKSDSEYAIAAEESVAADTKDYASEAQISDFPLECEENLKPPEAIQCNIDQDTQAIEENIIGQKLQGHQKETSNETEPKQEAREQTNETQENNIMTSDFISTEDVSQIKVPIGSEGTEEGENIRQEEENWARLQCDQSQSDKNVELKLGAKDEIDEVHGYESIKDIILTEEMEQEDENMKNGELNEKESSTKELQSISSAHHSVHEVKDVDTAPVINSESTNSDQNIGRTISDVAEDVNSELEESPLLKTSEEELKGPEKLVDITRSINDTSEEKRKEEKVEYQDIYGDNADVELIMLKKEETSLKDILLEAKSGSASTIAASEESVAADTKDYASEAQISDSPLECEEILKPPEAIQYNINQDTETIEENLIGQKFQGNQMETSNETEPKQEAREQTNERQENNIMISDFTSTEDVSQIKVPIGSEGTDEGENIRKQEENWSRLQCDQSQSDENVELKLGAKDEIDEVQGYESIKDIILTEEMELEDENMNNGELNEKESSTKELQSISSAYHSVHEMKDADATPVRNSESTNSDQNIGRTISDVAEDVNSELEETPPLKTSEEEIKGPKKLVDITRSINDISEEKRSEEKVEHQDICGDNADVELIMLKKEETSLNDILRGTKSESASTIASDIMSRESMETTYSGNLMVEEATRETLEKTSRLMSQHQTVHITDANMGTAISIETANDEVEDTKTSDTLFKLDDQKDVEICESREILKMEKIGTNKVEKDVSKVVDTRAGPIDQIVGAVVEGDVFPEQNFSAAKSKLEQLETSSESLLKEPDHDTSIMTENIGDDLTKKDEILVRESLEASFARSLTEMVRLQMEKAWEPKDSKLEFRPTGSVHNDSPNEEPRVDGITLEEASIVDTQEYGSEQHFSDSPTKYDTGMEAKEAIQCISQEIAQEKDLMNSVNLNKESNDTPLSHRTVRQLSLGEEGEKCKEGSNFQLEKTGKVLDVCFKSKDRKMTAECFQAATTELNTEEIHSGKTNEVSKTMNNQISSEKMEELKEVSQDSHLDSNEEDAGRRSYSKDELKGEEYSGVKPDKLSETQKAEQRFPEEYDETAVEKNIRKPITTEDRAIEGPHPDSVEDVTLGDILPVEKEVIMNIEKELERSDSKEQDDETKSRYTEKAAVGLSEGIASTEKDNLKTENSNKDTKDFPSLTLREILPGRVGKECEDASNINLKETKNILGLMSTVPSPEVLTGLAETDTKEKHPEAAIAGLIHSETKSEKTYEPNEVTKSDISNEKIIGEMEVAKSSHLEPLEEETFRKKRQEDSTNREEFQAEGTEDMFETTEKGTESGKVFNSQILMVKHNGHTSAGDKETAVANDEELQNAKLNLPPVLHAVVEEKPHENVSRQVKEVSKPSPIKPNHETVNSYGESKEISQEEENKTGSTQLNISTRTKDAPLEEQDSIAKPSQTEVISSESANAADLKQREKSLEHGEKRTSDEECKEITEFTLIDPAKFSLSELLQKSKKVTSQATENFSEPRDTAVKKELQAEKATGSEVEEAKTDDDKDEKLERENYQMADLGTSHPVIEEAPRDRNVKVAYKKSHNILSGVRSRVKHSISKVKKVITGKSSHPRPHSQK